MHSVLSRWPSLRRLMAVCDPFAAPASARTANRCRENIILAEKNIYTAGPYNGYADSLCIAYIKRITRTNNRCARLYIIYCAGVAAKKNVIHLRACIMQLMQRRESERDNKRCIRIFKFTLASASLPRGTTREPILLADT